MQNPLNSFPDFFDPAYQTPKSLADVILENIRPLIGDCPQCLIAQSYDGVAATSGSHGGVQVLVKEIYYNALLVHCYAHQLNLISQQATSQNSRVQIYLASLSEISSYFSRSPQRISALERVCDRRIPTPSTTRWNSKSKTVATVTKIKTKLLNVAMNKKLCYRKKLALVLLGLNKLYNTQNFNFGCNFLRK